MGRTRHIHKRMTERGINEQMLSVVGQFGVDQGDKIVLNRKAISLAMKELKKMTDTMEKMFRRGGVVVVVQDDIEITTYTLDSFSRKKVNNKVH
jgi:ASC-1-like (ASCH) protein